MSVQQYNNKENTIDNVDIDGFASMVGADRQKDYTKGKIKLTRREKKQIKRELNAQMRGINKELDKNRAKVKEIEKKSKKQKKSISQQLKERDKAISDKTRSNRSKRQKANNVVDYIPYRRMFKNGICEVEEGVFSQTLEFSDISYQSAREDHQTDVFDTMCDIYNYFDTSIALQFSVVNTKIPDDIIGKREFYNVENQKTETGKQDAELFNKILNDKMKEGVSNIKRKRYVTYTISAENLDNALHSLARIRTDLVAYFTKIACQVHVLNGEERLKLLQDVVKPESHFDFEYDKYICLSSGLTTKDFICPSALDFRPDGDNSCFRSDNKWCQVLAFTKFGAELNDHVLSDIVDLPHSMNVTWHSQAWDRADAITYLKQRAGFVDKEIVDEQQRSANKGQDFTVLSPEVQYKKDEISELLDNVLNKNQNLFTFTGLIYVYADTREELDNHIVQIIASARTKQVTIGTVNFRQREALSSVLPLGNNYLNQSRVFTTAQMAIFMPFATQELEDEGGIYAGQNKNSNNLVLVNRKSLASPVGFVSGKTGAGKSFFVKQEIEGTILSNPDDQIIMFDRAGEYTMITEHHDGAVFNFSVDSSIYLNPFDLSATRQMSRDAQIANKIDAMIAQASASAGEAGMGLTDEEQSIISRCVSEAFKRMEENNDKTPLLSTFCDILNEQPEKAAHDIALRYERFVSGPMAFFNHESNVSWENRIIDINIKELPDNMLIFCLIMMCESVRNRMYHNYEHGIRTWIYIEEIQSMFKYPSVLNYFSRFANEARKFGGLLTGITQNSTAMIDNEAARNIVTNADYVVLLKQSVTDRELWSDLLSLSPQEVSCIDETADRGAGLLISGPNKIPIVGGFPKNNKLYDLFSTDPNEVADRLNKERLFKNKGQ